MSYEFKKWQDFNNLSIKITIKTMILYWESFYLIIKKSFS